MLAPFEGVATISATAAPQPNGSPAFFQAACREPWSLGGELSDGGESFCPHAKGDVYWYKGSE
jgi:hypothetical protein